MEVGSLFLSLPLDNRKCQRIGEGSSEIYSINEGRDPQQYTHTHTYVRGVCLYMCVMRQSCDEPLKGAFFVVDWEVEECEESSQGMQGLSYHPPPPIQHRLCMMHV